MLILILKYVLLFRSPVLSVNVVGTTHNSKKRSIPLKEPVEFEIKHKPMKKVRKRKCTYWEFKYAKWSDDGCYELRKKSTETRTVCKCYHLTDFAIAVEELGNYKYIIWNIFVFF